MNQFREVASDLQFPEGPIAMEDGTILVVEIQRGTLTRIQQDGSTSIVAETGGGPNGAAVGPDGKVYICNNGGLNWRVHEGKTRPVGVSPDRPGSIQKVDLSTGIVETLYAECEGISLKAPNDLVFDSSGGFWFTDFGKIRQRDRDRTGVYYARADGSQIREVIFPLETPNGIGLSPDESTLYVAETITGRLFAWQLTGPGMVSPLPRSPHGGRLVVGLPGWQMFDSLAVDVEGNICVATLGNGGITIISPDGKTTELVHCPDPFTTNICFGGENRRTAYITLSASGRLVAMPWEKRGRELAY